MIFQIILFILFPIILILLISFFSFFYSETFNKIGFGKREISLLIVGSASTMFLDMPIFVYKNYFLALNIGGALIPIILSLYFIKQNYLSPIKMLIGIFLISFSTYMVTTVTEEGVVSYFPFYFLPPILSLLLSLLFFFRSPTASIYSYSISTLGVIIGGDLSHLPELFEKPFMGSMGGAGLYDMVYLAGLISFCITFPFVKKTKLNKIERLTKKFEREIYFASKFIDVKPSSFEYKNYKELKREMNRILNEINRKIEIFANPLDRIIAFIIDFSIIVTISIILYATLSISLYLFISFLLLLKILYFTILEFFLGFTVGKAIMDIEVRNVENKPIDFMGAFTRNIVRLIEFFAMFYLISLLLILTTPKKQRFGDMVADSLVVKVK